MFGQVVIGPPGAGKTMYCKGMKEFSEALQRKTAIVNLDPANDILPYECAVDINELVTLSEVMEEYELGPNGGLMFCMEYLEKNIDWLQEKLKPIENHYLLFDCPGQVELYTHHDSVKNIIKTLEKKGWRLTCVHLIDSYYCATAPNYISSLLLSMSTMLHLELPHVNVLSKIDLMTKFGKLDFALNFYTHAENLSLLNNILDRNQITSKYKKLNEILCEIVEDFGMVSFSVLNIEDKESVLRLLRVIDKANGYVYSGIGSTSVQLGKLDKTDIDYEYYQMATIQEKYILGEESSDEN